MAVLGVKFSWEIVLVFATFQVTGWDEKQRE